MPSPPLANSQKAKIYAPQHNEFYTLRGIPPRLLLYDYHMPFYVLLISLAIIVAIFDFRHRRIPNWVTFPILICGVIAHFPASPPIWFASIIMLVLGFTRRSVPEALLNSILAILGMLGRRNPQPVEVNANADAPIQYILGMGDVKLWLALLWAVPNTQAYNAAVALALAWIMTGTVELMWRAVRHQKIIGVQSAGAWASVPFSIILFSLYYFNIVIKMI
jgi:Flp pilus assembly protein protease CpaA